MAIGKPSEDLRRIGEQEIHCGLKKLTDVAGTFPEPLETFAKVVLIVAAVRDRRCFPGKIPIATALAARRRALAEVLSGY